MSRRTLESDILIDAFHVSVRKDMVELPDGSVIEDFYTVKIPDAAMICALTDEGEVLLKSECRYAIGEDVIECPAGMFEPGEADPLEVARRELLEETGYTASEWIYLGPTLESTSKLTNRMHLFLARGAVKTASQRLDANEHIDVLRVPLAEAVKMVMDGRINANSTAHLILKAERMGPAP